MGITSISGEIEIIIDAVTIEQINIERPDEVSHFPIALQAMVAALHCDEIKVLIRELSKCNHTMEYLKAEALDDDWLVTFKIRRKAAQEMGEQ